MNNIIRAGEASESSEPMQLPLRPGLIPERSEDGERKRIALRIRIAQQASDRTAQARVEREQILQSAKLESAAIIQQSRDTATAIVGGARNEQARIEEAARVQGLSAAKEHAKKEALAEIGKTLRIFTLAESELRGMKSEYMRSAADGIMELTEVILQRLVRGRMEIDRDLVKRTINDAIHEMSAVDRVTLRVNPEDLSAATEYETEIMNMVENLSEVTIVADASITPGGVLIETSFGRVDARLETQLSEMLRAVRIQVNAHEATASEDSPKDVSS